MNAYIYQAALYCETCGTVIRMELDAEGLTPSDVDDERSFDSDDYPKGPYPDGGGEADCPQHCGACGVFLKNPLTDEGMAYVRERIIEARQNNNRTPTAIRVWAPFYGIEVRL